MWLQLLLICSSAFQNTDTGWALSQPCSWRAGSRSGQRHQSSEDRAARGLPGDFDTLLFLAHCFGLGEEDSMGRHYHEIPLYIPRETVRRARAGKGISEDERERLRARIYAGLRHAPVAQYAGGAITSDLSSMPSLRNRYGYGRRPTVRVPGSLIPPVSVAVWRRPRPPRPRR